MFGLSFSIIWMGIRPKTLTMALMPVLVGLSLAFQQGAPLDFILLGVIGLSAMALQIATNLHNDAQDHVNGTDCDDRLGPLRITHAGLATPDQTKKLASFFFLLAGGSGAYLIFQGGWPIAMIGLCSIIAGYCYSGGPFPISRGPFGEFFVLAFFGAIAVTGAQFLFLGHWIVSAIWAGVFVGLPASAVLLLNNYRDLENDKRAGRCTLAILLGNKGARIVYALFMISPFIVLWVLKAELFVYAGFVLALVAIWRVWTVKDKKALNPCLGLSALSQSLNSVLFALSNFY